MIKNKITYKQVNSRNTAGFVGCIFNNLKKTPVEFCKCGCDRFAGIVGEYLFCGKQGTNKNLLNLSIRNNPLREILRSYDEDGRNCI